MTTFIAKADANVFSGKQEQAPEREVRGKSTQQAKSHQVPFLKFHPTLPGLLHK